MSQYLIISSHRALRRASFALQDRPTPHRETLDTDIVVSEVEDGLSLREAIRQHRSAVLQDAVERMGADTWTSC